jgi:hypothetical protein
MASIEACNLALHSGTVICAGRSVGGSQEQPRLVGVPIRVVVGVQEPLGQVFETGYVLLITVKGVIQHYLLSTRVVTHVER